MKALLISAPTCLWYEQAGEVGPVTPNRHLEPPVGILTLAAILRNSPWQTEIVDTNRDFRAHWNGPSRQQDFCAIFAEQICARSAEVYALGSICSTYPFTTRLATEIRRRRPDSIIVVGGPQASVVDVATLRSFSAIDYVVRGEADQTFPSLLKAVAGGEDPGCIPGLTFRRASEVVRNPNAPAVLDLDSLPLPAFDLYPDVAAWPFVSLEMGRGCPFACKFCSTNDFFRRNFRLKSPARVLAQMRQVEAVYGIRKFELIHDMFTVDRDRVLAFCEEMLRSGEGLEWSCSARTDCVDEQMLELMQGAGCTGIFFGVETGSPRMQRIIDKGLDLDEARHVLDYADRLPIPMTVSLIMGYPEETMDDFRQTVGFLGDALRLDLADLQLHRLAPLAETPMIAKYQDRLVLDGFYSDISRLGSGYYDEDMRLISAHPEIFPNFFALPCALPREYLQESRAFLVNGSTRCKSLLAALHQESGDLLQVFEEWIRWRPAPTCFADYYSKIGFLEDLLKFTAEKYMGRGWVATEVACRYYRALVDYPAARPNPAGHELEGDDEVTVDAIPALSADTRILHVRGDVVKVLRAIRERQTPPRGCVDRNVAVAVRPCPGSRFSVTELPAISAVLLDMCDGRSTVSDLAQALAHRDLPGGLSADRFCPYALDILRRQGLIRLFLPPRSAEDEIELAEPISPLLPGGSPLVSV